MTKTCKTLSNYVEGGYFDGSRTFSPIIKIRSMTSKSVSKELRSVLLLNYNYITYTVKVTSPLLPFSPLFPFGVEFVKTRIKQFPISV